jgi:hypothetical protein
VGEVIDEMVEEVEMIKAVFKDHHPYQYTIADSQERTL